MWQGAILADRKRLHSVAGTLRPDGNQFYHFNAPTGVGLCVQLDINAAKCYRHFKVL
jgi:hypothetical protein